MTELITEETPITEKVEFATFWSRAGAYLLDVIILAAFTISINVINIANFKSFWIYLPFTIIAILYKPFMEHKYEATIGKMIFKLRVTDHNLNPIGFNQSFLRSIILIFPAIVLIPIYFLAFNNPYIIASDHLYEFAIGMAIEYPIQGWINNLSFLIVLTDVIVLLTDPTKTQRSLHDRIAKTYVTYDRE